MAEIDLILILVVLPSSSSLHSAHRAAQNESYEFKFGVAGMKELDESEVSLWKVVKGEDQN